MFKLQKIVNLLRCGCSYMGPLQSFCWDTKSHFCLSDVFFHHKGFPIVVLIAAAHPLRLISSSKKLWPLGQDFVFCSLQYTMFFFKSFYSHCPLLCLLRDSLNSVLCNNDLMFHGMNAASGFIKCRRYPSYENCTFEYIVLTHLLLLMPTASFLSVFKCLLVL